MHIRKKLSIEKTNYSFSYKNAIIPYTIWSSWNGTNTIETVIFLGTVQIDKMVRWVAESCPLNTVVVQGAPHWSAKSDGSDIPEYMFDFTKCAFDTLLEKFPIAKVHIIAESQAVPGILGLFVQEKYSRYLKKLTLLQPLGFNSLIYQGTDEQRIKTFKRRIAVNTLHQVPALILDRRLRYNHHLANKVVGIGLRNPEARAQYSSGLKHDAISDLKQLNALHTDALIICGGNDRIFPAAEIATTLAENRINIDIHIVKGIPHSPLATRYGQKLMVAALNR